MDCDGSMLTWVDNNGPLLGFHAGATNGYVVGARRAFQFRYSIVELTQPSDFDRRSGRIRMHGQESARPVQLNGNTLVLTRRKRQLEITWSVACLVHGDPMAPRQQT